jgi:hypothetical protein
MMLLAMISAFDPLKDAAADFVNAFGPSGSDFAQWITVGLFACGFLMCWLVYRMGTRLEGRKHELEHSGLICTAHTWSAEAGPCPFCRFGIDQAAADAAISRAFHVKGDNRGV